MKGQMKMKNGFLILVILSVFVLQGCASKTFKVGVAGAGGAALGALVGHQFVHHGSKKQHETTNTIITASLFGVLAMGLTYWHFTALENKEVELASRFSRSNYLEAPSSSDARLSILIADKKSIRLDQETRWVFPEFRRRSQPAERRESELVEKHTIWEIAKPGFFVTKDQYPSLWMDEEEK